MPRAVRGYRAKTGVDRFFAQHPNLLRGQKTTVALQIWVGDISYLVIAGPWFYPAIIMDYHSRRVLGWSLRPGMGTGRRTAVRTAAVGAIGANGLQSASWRSAPCARLGRGDLRLRANEPKDVGERDRRCGRGGRTLREAAGCARHQRGKPSAAPRAPERTN